MESMEKQLEAHLHEEPKFWSFIVLCHKQIMNARMKATWRIQVDINCWTLLEHLLEPIWCILYVVSKLGKLAIQRFKWCANRSWNEEVRAIGSRSHQAEGQFRRLWNQPLAVKSFRSHIARLRNFTAILCACEMLLSASRYLRPTLLDLLLQIFDV